MNMQLIANLEIKIANLYALTAVGCVDDFKNLNSDIQQGYVNALSDLTSEIKTEYQELIESLND